MKLKEKNFFEKIITLLLNVLIFIFGIVLLVLIYTGVQTKILGNDYANFFGYSTFEVQTGSMAYTINAGDWIIIKLTQKVKLNDIVTYKSNDEYITHRIIEAYSGAYITKGDANNAKDEPIKKSQVVGKVVSILASFGIVRKIFFNPAVLISLIITLFLISLAFKKSKDENDNSFFGTIIKKITLFFNKIKGKKSKKSNISEADLENYKKLIETPVTEEDLDKTSLYRVIPVNLSEIDDTFKEIAKNAKKSKTLNKEKKKNTFFNLIINKIGLFFSNIKKLISNIKSKKITENNVKIEENNNIPEVKKEDLENVKKDQVSQEPVKAEQIEPKLEDSTSSEVIPVDSAEIDNTLLEIANNEINEAKQNDKNKEELIDLENQKKEQEAAEVIDEETLTKIELGLLKNDKGKKKGKNVIDTVMIIKEEELSVIIDTLIEDNKAHTKGSNIKEMLMDTYIDAKYYNSYGDKNFEHSSKNSVSKIEEAIKDVALASTLIDGNHDNEIVDMYSNIFILIANLEQAKDSITDSKAKNEFYKKEIKKYFKDWNVRKIEHVIGEIVKAQRNYAAVLERFLKKLETSMFNLSFNKLTTKKDMYGLTLEHNVTFSKVYSDYIIDKTYTEGIIAEDKISVLLTLLLVQLIKDMTSSNFNRKYILYIPRSLYDKEKKFVKLLSMIDDKYAKDNVIILIRFEDLLNNKEIVTEIRKMGNKFALVFDEATVIEEKDRGNIYIADYIFASKSMKNILSVIPEELLNNVIYEDIVNKIGDFGSE